jgi:hypothetical protein
MPTATKSRWVRAARSCPTPSSSFEYTWNSAHRDSSRPTCACHTTSCRRAGRSIDWI